MASKAQATAAKQEAYDKLMGPKEHVSVAPAMFVPPSNETVDDIAMQIKVCEAVGKGWGVHFVRSSSFWIMYDQDSGSVLGVCIIAREAPIYRYHVLHHAHQLAKSLGVGCYCLLSTSEGILWSVERGFALVSTVDIDRGPELVSEICKGSLLSARRDKPNVIQELENSRSSNATTRITNG